MNPEQLAGAYSLEVLELALSFLEEKNCNCSGGENE